MKKFARWTDAEDLLLQAGVADGLDLRAIAKLVDRTRGGTRHRMAELGLRSQRVDERAWTAEQETTLREHYGKPGVNARELARRIGKSHSALKNRVHQLGLKHDKFWSLEELQYIRDHVPTDEPADIAKALGCTLGSIYQRIAKLGLRSKNAGTWVTKAEIATVKKLYAKGLSDMQIAKRAGMTYGRADHIRTTYIGKPANVDPTAHARSVANQLKTLGLTSPTQLRSRAFRLFAIESGWPEDLRPREVQILNALARSGVPMSALELAEAIGSNTSPTWQSGKRRILLASNGGHGTYTAELIARGLVIGLVNAGPRCKETGKGCGRRSHLYTLGPVALAILQERACAKQTQSSNATGTPKARTRSSG